jgi:cell division protein FtsN
VPAKSVPAIAQKDAGAARKSIIDTTQVSAAARAQTASVVAKTAGQPYSIAAAAFRTRDSAEASLVLLRKQGLSAFIIYQEPYYRVYVGAFAGKNDAKAKRDLEKVKRVFKDAYIKLR